MAQKVKTASARTVTTAGTRVALSATDVYVPWLIIQADPGNAEGSYIYVGDVSVTSANGIALSPTVSASIDGGQIAGNFIDINLKEIYIDASANGLVARISYGTVKR